MAGHGSRSGGPLHSEVICEKTMRPSTMRVTLGERGQNAYVLQQIFWT